MTLAIAAASIFSFSSFAQTPDKACCNPYEGLNLTTQQKEKLNKITTPAQSLKENRDKQRADRDKVRVERKKQATAQRENRKNLRANYLKEVRTVLTPEQYVQFLENNYVNAGSFKAKNMAKGKKHGNRTAGKGHKNSRDCKKDNCNQNKTTAYNK